MKETDTDLDLDADDVYTDPDQAIGYIDSNYSLEEKEEKDVLKITRGHLNQKGVIERDELDELVEHAQNLSGESEMIDSLDYSQL